METLARKVARKLVKDLVEGKALPPGLSREPLELAIEASLLDEIAPIDSNLTAALSVRRY